MDWLRSTKLCAALVLIGWLAALVSLWGMTGAVRDAVAGDETCIPKDLDNRGLQLEMAASPREALQVLNGETPADACVPTRIARLLDASTAEARCISRGVSAGDCGRGVPRCIRRGMAAQVRADYVFIPCYSALTLALFLFVGTFWDAPAQERKRPFAAWGLPAVGVLLALAMAVGDVRENLQLAAILRLAETDPAPEAEIATRLPLLAQAGTLKWGALALSAVLLAAFWRSRSSPRRVWVPRLLGLAAAGALAAGLLQGCWRMVYAGMAGLGLLWSAGLLHALAVAVAPAPVSHPQSPQGGSTKP